MKFLLAKKVNMSQIFNAEGRVIPVTILTATPSIVTQVKTKERDGYTSVQLGFGKKRADKIGKPRQGHLHDLPSVVVLKEFAVANSDVASFERGQEIGLDIFAVGDRVAVASVSKGKGFQGVVKRHGFHGGPRTHGQKHSEREAGSIGGGGRAGGRVAKGMRMAGRMGGDRVTQKHMAIVAIDPENNTLMIKGAIPGRRGTLVELREN